VLQGVWVSSAPATICCDISSKAASIAARDGSASARRRREAEALLEAADDVGDDPDAAEPAPVLSTLSSTSDAGEVKNSLLSTDRDRCSNRSEGPADLSAVDSSVVADMLIDIYRRRKRVGNTHRGKMSLLSAP
jgi:hypothetical protein